MISCQGHGAKPNISPIWKKKANLGYIDRNQFFEFDNDRLSVAAQQVLLSLICDRDVLRRINKNQRLLCGFCSISG